MIYEGATKLILTQFNLTPTMRALLGLGTTLPSCLVTLITVIYSHILNSNSPEVDTIQTWTCRYKNSQPLEQDITLPSNMGNEDFSSLCTESVSHPSLLRCWNVC
jgi:hypothetical protein